MGRLIETLALEAGHSIAAIVDPLAAEFKKDKQVFDSIDDFVKANLKIDAAIEFTHPDKAADNIKLLAKEKIPVVCGTTGWYSKLPEISDFVNAAGTSLFWAPNFSLGMNLFYRLAEYAAEIFDPFAEYDAGGFEIHHNKKADSPSGTAKAIAEKMLNKMKRKKKAVYETLNRPPAADELHFASMRAGFVPGTHTIVFDSAADSIEITHSLRNRNGLASGTIKAAEWLCSQKRTGVFTMDDMLVDILG